MTDRLEWIDAVTALKMVERELNGRGDAKRALAECLRDGDIRSKASEHWQSKVRSISEAWQKDADKPELLTDVEIPKQVYRSSTQWSQDQDCWRWPVNNFSITFQQARKNRRHMLLGVQINRLDIERVILKRNPSGVGSPGKPEARISLCLALIGLERQGLLNQVTFPTIASLEREVLEQINDALTEKAIGPTISQVWKRYVDRHIPTDRH